MIFILFILVPLILNGFAIYAHVSEEGIVFFQDTLILLVCILAVAYVHSVYQSFQPDDRVRRVWRMLGLGTLSYAIGESIYFVYEVVLGITDPFPCLGDVFIVGGYIFFILAAVKALRDLRSVSMFHPQQGLYVAILSAAVFTALILRFAAYPAWVNDEDPLYLRLLAQVYPLLDLIGFALYIRLFFIFFSAWNTSFARPWLIFTFGFLIFMLGDLLYSYIAIYEITPLYLWINIIWYFAYAMTFIACREQYLLMRQYEQENITDAIETVA